MRRLSAFLIENTSVREPQARWTGYSHWLIHQLCWGSERLQGNRGRAALFWRHDPLRSAKRESNRKSDPRHKWAKASFESFGGLQRPQLEVALQIVCQGYSSSLQNTPGPECGVGRSPQLSPEPGFFL